MIRLNPNEFKAKFCAESHYLFFIHKKKEKEHRTCTKCHSEFMYLIFERKRFYWKCGNSYCPLKSTIFYKSITPLVEWFKTIYKFATTKIGVTSLEVSRASNLNYKTAFRMTHLIKSLFLNQEISVEKAEFEIDESYVAEQEKNKHNINKTQSNQGRSLKTKTAVVGIMNKNTGKVKTFIAHKINGNYVRELVSSLIAKKSSINTDKAIFYWKLKKMGYKHKMVDHSRNEHVGSNGGSTNFIESFWSILKRSINGSHIWISVKWFINYLIEFTWRFNYRKSSFLNVILNLI